MENKPADIIHPIGILKEAISLWGRNLIPIAAIYSVNVFLISVLRMFKPLAGACRYGVNVFIFPLLFIAAAIIVALIGLYIGLTVLNYYREVYQKRGGQLAKSRPSNWPKALVPVLKSAYSSLVFYLKALFLLWGFVVVMAVLASLFLIGGHFFYSGGAAFAIRLIILVAASTVFVVILLSGAWYGFFFSLAPIIAAFEKKGPWVSMKESRARIKGNALRYLFVLSFYFIVYWGIGLAIILLAIGLAAQKSVLYMFDPAMAIVFGPLFFAIWLLGYLKLSERD